jgi:hypothetical protein
MASARMFVREFGEFAKRGHTRAPASFSFSFYTPPTTTAQQFRIIIISMMIYLSLMAGA